MEGTRRFALIKTKNDEDHGLGRSFDRRRRRRQQDQRKTQTTPACARTPKHAHTCEHLFLLFVVFVVVVELKRMLLACKYVIVRASFQ